MKLPLGGFKKLLKLKQKSHPQRALDGGLIYKIRLIGQTSPLISFCIEDILIDTADNLGIGITFTKKNECDLCIACDDALLGHRMGYLCGLLEKIKAPIFAFGIGSEGPLKKLSGNHLKSLKRALNQMKNISVRNQTVANQLRSFLNREKITIVGEPIFNFKPLTSRPTSKTKKIGIAVVKLEKSEYEPNKFYKNFAKHIDRLMEDFSAQAHFLCFARGGVTDDEVVSQKIIKSLKHKDKAFLHPFTSDLLLSYSRINTVDYLLSMRSTAAVVGLLCGKPVVVMEKRGSRGEEIFGLLKCQEILMQDFDLDLNNLDIRLKNIKKIFSRPKKNAISLTQLWRKKQYDFAQRMLKSLFVH